MKKTVLYESHIALGARMAPFGGFMMPIRYSGIINEHNATRLQAAVFDTCHMGEFRIMGDTALQDLERVLSCKVSTLKIGQCRYGLICNEQGGIIDDQIIYRMGENDFFMVVNAATEEGDFEWVAGHISPGTRVMNLSAVTAKLDIQGPNSPGIIKKLLSFPIDDLKYFHFMHDRYCNENILLSRTGYTGEIGFEIYCNNEYAVRLWDDCRECGALPAGLGARDTLRLEMGYPLYGHELDSSTNAAESALTRAIASDKEFVGSGRVLDCSNVKKSLAGIELDGRRSARRGDAILSPEGLEIGTVTSGSFCPSVSKALALGYINKEFSVPGAKINVVSERAELSGTVAQLPFYKQATCRADIRRFL